MSAVSLTFSLNISSLNLSKTSPTINLPSSFSFSCHDSFDSTGVIFTSVGTATRHSTTIHSITFQLTALVHLSIHQSTHTELGNGSLITTANHYLTPSFSVYFNEQRKWASLAKPSQAKSSQVKVLIRGGELCKTQVDIPLSVTYSCVLLHSWAQ